MLAFAAGRGDVAKAGKRTVCFGNFDVYFYELVNVDNYVSTYCPSCGAIAASLDGWRE
jgi:hypothetical protein